MPELHLSFSQSSGIQQFQGWYSAANHSDLHSLAGLDYLGNPNLVHAQSILATLGVQVCGLHSLLMRQDTCLCVACSDLHFLNSSRLFVQAGLRRDACRLC